MIYGALGDIEEYRGMLKGLDVLIDWLEENDPAKLEVGSHPILGDKVFANVMAPTTRPEAEAHYETHQRYHDLQIDVEGREAFKVATGSLTLVQEFDEKDDYDLVDSDASIAGDLADDKFALFVAGEPHMPTLEFQGDGAQPVKKICFKLLADAYWEESRAARLSCSCCERYPLGELAWAPLNAVPLGIAVGGAFVE